MQVGELVDRRGGQEVRRQVGVLDQLAVGRVGGVGDEVVEVGPGGMVDGNEVKMVVKKGDRILYTGYSQEVKIDGVELKIVKQSDILAIVQ